MAGNSRDQFVPEILANADDIQFAEDIVDYMMRHNSPRYNLQRDQPFRASSHAFDQIAQRAVKLTERILKISNDDTFLQIRRTNSLSLHSYKTLVERGASSCFTKEFNARTFLNYCVTISRIAALFYNYGISGVPELAIKQISIVLQNYNMTAGGWDTLRRVAQQLDDVLIVNELATLSTHSGEIEPLMNSQEVIGYDSMNSLLSRKNVLSENEENNLRQKEVGECSKEAFLKLCTQYFSENSTVICSCPLKEPKSPSDDSSATFNLEGNRSIDRSESMVKISPRTSKIDQEYVHGDLKIIDLSRNLIINKKSEIDDFKIKLIDKTALDDNLNPIPSSACQKSELSNKIDCNRNLDTGMKAKDNEKSETLTTEGDKLKDTSSSEAEFPTETSNADQTSIFSSTKENIDLPSDEKNGANYPSRISDGSNLVKSELPEKLFSETPDRVVKRVVLQGKQG